MVSKLSRLAKPGEYAATVTEVATVYRAKCFGCGCVGPVGDNEAIAIDLAETAAKWRQYQGFLFCASCACNAQDVLSRKADQ